MIGDLIKIFADEPEKMEKAVLAGVKVLLNILIAAWLYKIVVGSFYLFPLDSKSEWENFLVSGRILVCILFYFISGYLLFQLFSIPCYILAWLFSQLKPINSKTDFRLIFKFFGVLKFKEGENIPLPGKNFDVLINLSKAFETKESRSEMEGLKQTFIANVLEVYAAFVVVYFFILPNAIRQPGLTKVVLVGLVFVIAIYAIIHGLIDYMQEYYEEIAKAITFINIYGIIQGLLHSHGIFSEKPPSGEGIGKCRVFTRGRKEYVLCRPFIDRRMLSSDNEIERLLQKRKKQDRVFLIVAAQGVLTNGPLLQATHPSDLLLVEYCSEDHLRSQLSEVLRGL